MIRWFVGLGSGTQPSQIEAQKEFVSRYNHELSCGPVLKLEVVPNTSAYDRLKTEIASGNPPDIIGPVGTSGRNGFEGLFLDLAPLVGEFHTDLSGFEPAVVDYLKQGSDGQIGLPYLAYPGFILYNKELFTRAGLPEPPHKVGELFQGRDWSWENLPAMAKRLTLDKNGRNATQAGFDPNGIVRYGLDFGYADARRMASCFAGGSLAAGDRMEGSLKAQIPPAWEYAWRWYYDAMWKDHFAADSRTSQLLQLGGPWGDKFGSGYVAMETAWGWQLASFASQAGGKLKSWDIAVMPSYNGQTSSPLDMDTFVIPKASKRPREAYQVMLVIMADPNLKIAYGGMPAQISERDGYFASLDASLASAFPGNRVDWSVVSEMAKYPAIPSHEADVPYSALNLPAVAAFYDKLRTDSKLDVTAALENLRNTLQSNYDRLVIIGP